VAIHSQKCGKATDFMRFSGKSSRKYNGRYCTKNNFGQKEMTIIDLCSKNMILKNIDVFFFCFFFN